MFLTTGGDWAQKKRAEKLTQYLDGAFDASRTYEQSADVFRDGCIFGTGVLYVYPDYSKGEVCTEKCWIEEIIIDDVEAQYGSPRQMFRSRLINREKLMAMFPEKKDLIANAASATTSASQVHDMIQVIYGWHLPSSEEGVDGKYTCAIKEGVLCSEPYNKSYFPFVFFKYTAGLRGFYGQGIVENLFQTQLEINMICRTIQQSVYFAAVPRVFLSSDSKVNSQHLDNRVGSIVKYQGSKPPTFDTPTAQNPEMYNYLEYLWNKCFQQVGLSEMSAVSQKPAGLDAAVAIREFHDIESMRFSIVGQAWEQYFLDLAAIFVDISKDLYAKDKSLSVKVKDGKFIETIKWKDVNMPDDKYVVRCFPTSILPTQPSARLQFVQELIQAGFIDKAIGLDLLEYPDLERVVSLRTAAVDTAMMILENIVDEGKYDTPEEYFDLDVCLTLGNGMYLKAKNNGVDEEKQELLRRFIDDCADLKRRGLGQQQVEAPVAEAAPEPTPQSNLIPNM
jgi:hypothetical protein